MPQSKFRKICGEFSKNVWSNIFQATQISKTSVVVLCWTCSMWFIMIYIPYHALTCFQNNFRRLPAAQLEEETEAADLIVRKFRQNCCNISGTCYNISANTGTFPQTKFQFQPFPFNFSFKESTFLERAPGGSHPSGGSPSRGAREAYN